MSFIGILAQLLENKKETMAAKAKFFHRVEGLAKVIDGLYVVTQSKTGLAKINQQKSQSYLEIDEILLGKRLVAELKCGQNQLGNMENIQISSLSI